MKTINLNGFPIFNLKAWPFMVFLVALVFLSACTSCEEEPKFLIRPLPKLCFSTKIFPDYGSLHRDLEQAWRGGIDALRRPLLIPRAMEVRLDRKSRPVWKSGLEALIRYQGIAGDIVLPATLRWPDRSPCTDIQRVQIPFLWEIEAQILIQPYRDLYWRMALLDWDRLAIEKKLRQAIASIGQEHIREAPQTLILPLKNMLQVLEDQSPLYAWEDLQLLRCMARERPHLLQIEAIEHALLVWHQRVLKEARWKHLAGNVEPALRKIEAWKRDYRAFLKSFQRLNRQVQAFEEIAGRSSSKLQCLSRQIRIAGRSVKILNGLLKMQWELANALERIHWLQNYLEQGEGEISPQWLPKGLNQYHHLAQDIEVQVKDLMGLEMVLWHRLDQSHKDIWKKAMPQVTHALSHRFLPQSRSASQWRKDFFALRKTFPKKNLKPEPLQPKRHGRYRSPYISKVIDLARSPASVAQIEQGLLAIAELNAHIRYLDREIQKICRKDSCAPRPPVDIPYSPRQGIYIQSWHQTPLEARTLGQDLLVLELTHLHLARQTQRLAQWHEWIGKHMPFKISEKLLDDLEKTWSLYTDRDGTYVKFLKGIVELLDACKQAPYPSSKTVHISPYLRSLLEYQWALVELTLDYARFVDRNGDPPIPLHTLLEEWKHLHQTLFEVERITLERDQKLSKARDKSR